MSIELKQAAEKALVVLVSATSFMSRKARDQHESVVAELRAAIQQAEAQQPDNAACRSVQKRLAAQQPATGEPVYWEWRHLSTHPDTVDFGKWSEWKRVEALSAIHTIEDALAEFRAYIAQGYKYELRALYDRPAPSVPADVVRDAERYRWLRDEHIGNCPESINLSHGRKPGLDAAIDAAIDAAMLAAK